MMQNIIICPINACRQRFVQNLIVFIIANKDFNRFQSDRGLRLHINKRHRSFKLEDDIRENTHFFTQPLSQPHQFSGPTEHSQSISGANIDVQSGSSTALDGIANSAPSPRVELPPDNVNSGEVDNDVSHTASSVGRLVGGGVRQVFSRQERHIESYPSKAGCVRACIGVDGSRTPKLALSVFAAHHPEAWNPYSPFRSAEEWQTVVLAIDQRLTKHKIDEWIKQRLWKVDTFQSAEKLWDMIDSIPDALGPQSWMTQDLIIEEESGQVQHSFHYRNPLHCIQLLLRHLPFRKHLVWAPEREYSDSSHQERVYNDMHTGDYWWEEQEKLPKGATLVPLICGLDKMLLTTMAGNQSAWPVYITIGNLPKHVRKKSSSNAVLLLALLLKFPKGYQASNTRESIHRALTVIFQPLKEIYSTGIDIDCADSFVRLCYPRLAVWIGDTPEQNLLTSVVGGFCPVCTVPKESLGNQSKLWPRRSALREPAFNQDQKMLEAQQQTQSLSQEHSEVLFVERLWPGFDRYRIVAPDIFHQLHLSLFKHYILPWTLELLKQSNKERPVHIKVCLVDKFDWRIAALP
jgi:hypothetical protein